MEIRWVCIYVCMNQIWSQLALPLERIPKCAIYSLSPCLLQGPFYDLQSFTEMLCEVLENLRATPGKGIICAYPCSVMNCCNCCCTLLNSVRPPFWQVWHFYINFPKHLPLIVVIMQKGNCKDRSCSFNWQMSIRLRSRGGLRLPELKLSAFMVVLVWWQARGCKLWGKKYCFPVVNTTCLSAFFYF